MEIRIEKNNYFTELCREREKYVQKIAELDKLISARQDEVYGGKFFKAIALLKEICKKYEIAINIYDDDDNEFEFLLEDHLDALYEEGKLVFGK